MFSFLDFLKNKPQIDEMMTSSGGDIRGLGMVSGSPDGGMNTWATLNAADADTKDQIMNQIKKDHENMHAAQFVQKVVSTTKSKR